jgi:succinyl-diaminopimelate desuccinylase
MDTPSFERLSRYLDGCRDEVIELQRFLVAIPALGPDNGGAGETEKAEFLARLLREMGVPQVLELDAPDPRVPSGCRPSIAAVLPGLDSSRTLWVIAHTDIVPAGDPSLWQSDPFSLVVDGDFVVGRGTEDNHQGIVSGLLVMKGLIELGISPAFNYGLLLVADEETGSKYGLDWVVEHHKELFTPGDLFLVPDFGTPGSDMVEVAEKSMLWLKLSVFGKQCHASTPGEGINSLVAASDLVLRLRTLPEEFPDMDALFNPPHSTFEPTKKEANVPNVNTIPGLDVFYIDCRVLPGVDLDGVLSAVRARANATESAFGVKVEIDVVQREVAAPPTEPGSEVVRRVLSGIREVYGVEGRPAGIGGGTVAAYLRRRGYRAAVWSTLVHNAHQPNERSSIPKTIGDAKVMAHMALG